MSQYHQYQIFADSFFLNIFWLFSPLISSFNNKKSVSFLCSEFNIELSTQRGRPFRMVCRKILSQKKKGSKKLLAKKTFSQLGFMKEQMPHEIWIQCDKWNRWSSNGVQIHLKSNIWYEMHLGGYQISYQMNSNKLKE